MPYPIKFGTKEETLPLPKNAKKDAKPKTKTVDNIINTTNPAWTKPQAISKKMIINLFTENYIQCSLRNPSLIYT